MNVTYKLYRFIEQNGRAEYKINRVKGGERTLSAQSTYSIDKPLETESLVLHILLTVWVGKCKAKQHKTHTVDVRLFVVAMGYFCCGNTVCSVSCWDIFELLGTDIESAQNRNVRKGMEFYLDLMKSINLLCNQLHLFFIALKQSNNRLLQLFK